MISIALCVLCCLTALAPSSAHADEVYQYTGSTYDYGYLATPPNQAFSITIDAASALAPNSTYPLEFQLSGSGIIKSFSVNGTSDLYGAPEGGSVTTNSAGAIVSWTVSDVYGPNNSGMYSSSTAVQYEVGTGSVGSGPPMVATAPLYDAVIYNDGAVYDYAYGSTTPGTWTASTVPLPGAGWLMLSALASLGVLGRRRMH